MRVTTMYVHASLLMYMYNVHCTSLPLYVITDAYFSSLSVISLSLSLLISIGSSKTDSHSLKFVYLSKQAFA